MTALPPDAVADLYRLVAELEQRLESSFAAHDEAIARAAATAQENAQLRNELGFARDRQNASADILGTIANASGDAEASLQRIAETTARLFDAASVSIRIADGNEWGLSIRFGASAERIGAQVPAEQRRVGGRNLPGTVFRENRQIHIPDLDHIAPEMADWPVTTARAAGTRTVAGTPLRREGKAIGALIVFRDRLAPFTDDELALQQSFADQAAIALENARLFNETREALSAQTATADILRVISQSPTDVQPVFDAIVVAAVRLLGCDRSFMLRCDGNSFWSVARAGTEGPIPVVAPLKGPIDPEANFPSRAIVQRKTLHLPDWSVIDLPEFERGIHETLGYRSTLYLPLLRGDECVGLLGLARKQAGVFDENEIALAESFRDQALIALENTRLFNETKEALERQTATSDILKVIASSPSDVQPVFDVIVERAVRLCDARMGRVYRFDGDLIHLVGGHGLSVPARDSAERPFPRPASDDTIVGRVMLTRRPNILADLDEDATVPPLSRQMISALGARSQVTMPMLLAGEPIGAITLSWAEPRGYTDQTIALLQTFADQAVIAIENVRLFNETKEALEQQQASANILRVVSNSVADTQPVFDEILNSIEHLFDAEERVIFLAGADGMQHIGAIHGPSSEKVRAQFPAPLEGTASEIALRERRLISSADVFNDPEIPAPARERARQFGNNYAMVVAPMLWEDRAVGSLLVARASMVPFSEKECNLLRTFADQAVIAIQNARLFDEVQQRTNDLSESLQQQTATADVLKVISRSAFDLQTMLDTLVESAARLCEADMAAITRQKGNEYFRAGSYGFTSEFMDYVKDIPVRPERATITGRTLLEGRVIHVPDVHTDPDYAFTEAQRLSGDPRTFLGVPLLREGNPVGALVLLRKAARPFTDKQIELVTTFADQAVIAIENVRLFDEVQAKTRDLSEALTYQTGSANILSVIASSPTDVGPVLQAIVESACGLCEAYDAIVLLKDGDDLRFSAHYGSLTLETDKWPINRNWTAGRAFLDRKPVHLHDLLSDEGNEFPDAQELSRRGGSKGIRSILGVPLLRENESIGVILLRRLEVHPFSDKQIALLQTFADQAVIAIGNVRLFDEVQAKTRDLSEALTYQTGSANILRVIASSPTDVMPVLKAIVESACELCEANDALASLKDGDELVFQAQHGSIPVVWVRQPVDREGAAGLAVIDRTPVHVHDLLGPEGEQFPRAREFARTTKVRTVLCVPLLREGESIGVIVLRRTEVRPFSDKQIALLQTFADQAVIAIGNVRLFEEVQARTRELSESLQQQTATADVLQIISSSPGDLAPVFEKMLVNATRVCSAKFGTMLLAENGSMRPAAQYNVPAEFAAARGDRVLTPSPRSALAKAINTKQVVHVADMRTTAAYLERAPASVELVELGGARTAAIVPMLRDDEVIGAITVYRNEVQLFSDKQIELLSNFAKQAVIAIENARLLKELRQRTDDLSQSLDDLRTAQDRLIQTEKLASLGQLTAGIAHEIKNPLNFVNNFAALSAELTDELNDVLKQAEITEKIREEVDELTGLLKDNLQKVVQHGQRADSIVKNMLLHSREGSGDHRPADINALVDESLNLAYHGARAERPDFNVTLERDFDAGAGTVEVFPQEITRVFLNLVSNGFYAVNKRRIEAGQADFDPVLRAATRNLGDAVEIRIRDNGTGIPPQVKDKMFNPFFTTKPAGEGTGLGLSMSHDIIVKQHNGTIDVDTEPGHFTEFRIVLPRTGKSSK